jgi:methylmalonyl-CoA/ethylmalonyl-CoA epimerase
MDNPETQVQLNEISQIAVTVRNLAEAKRFYQDVLGMRFLFEAGTMSFFQCGTVRLMIGATEKPVETGGTILYFRVPEIRQAHASLLRKDVTFVQDPHLVARMKSHDLWLAFFKDPSGNTLALMSEEGRNEEA